MAKEYIEALPGDWPLERLNNVANLYGRIGWQGLTADEYQDEGPWLVTGTDFQNGKVNWTSCVHISEKRWEEAWQIKLQPNDLLITKDGTVGKLAIVENMPGKASLNSGVIRIVPLRNSDYSTKYLYYVLQTDVFMEWFKDINAGASTIQHLFQKDFKHFVFPLPPLSEQNIIAERLDKFCERFDEAAATLEKQISLLKRYRASVIHEGVTRGLEPTAPTKFSGVDWIGDIPEDWSCNKIKNISVLKTGKTPDTAEQERYYDGTIDWFTPGDLSDAAVNSAEKTITSRAIKDGAGSIIPTNSVLLVGIGATAGKTGFLQIDAATNQQITALIPKEPFDGKYLFYVLLSMRKRMNDLALYATVPILNNQYIGGRLIPEPPHHVQRLIANYLDARTAAIDGVLDTKRKQLDILKRCRQSLIYEYVTGKRRVTEEA
jgi:type I restriction enzyme S subunit